MRSLDDLEDIELSNNGLVDIEEGAFIGLPKTVWNLWLYKNKLNKLEAKMWKGLEKVAKLNMWNNELTFISHDSFGPDLDITHVLDLSGNKIKHVDPDSFHYMSGRLYLVYLSSNQLEWVPCFQGNFVPKLEYVVENNPLRCQPSSCWLDRYHESGCGATTICQQLATIKVKRIVCCKPAETLPNATCMSNPENYTSLYIIDTLLCHQIYGSLLRW